LDKVGDWIPRKEYKLQWRGSKEEKSQPSWWFAED